MGKEKKEKKEKKDKKVTFGGIVNNIITLIGSRLVFGGLLAFLGIRIVFDPNSAPKKIVWGLGLAIIIAMVGLIIGFIKTKSFNRSNLVSIIETIVFTILGVCMIIFDKAFAPMVQELAFILIIFSCVVNILCLKNFMNIQTRIDKKKEEKQEETVVHDVNKAIKDDFVRYNGELINAAGYVKKKTDTMTWLQILLCVILIIFSIVMLATEFAGMGSVYYISGIIMVLSGLNDIVLGIRSFKEKKDVDELSEAEEA